MKSRALQDRSGISGMTGEFEQAIQFAYAALPNAASERDREMILLSIATGFSELGVIDVARDAYLVVLATAQDQYVRWIAAMNMMEIAGRQRSEPVFDRYRRELANVQLTSYLHAKFLILVGNGYLQFGRRELAISTLEEAIQYSREKGLNHLVFEAEAALAVARSEARVSASETVGRVPDGIASVAEAIREMRQTADAGA
jgi:tetratricopeptide (TPR) repeat protein